MTTASGDVAVIATQLAQTDRRALSEAWYSALHLAANASGARPTTKRSTVAGLSKNPAQTAPPNEGLCVAAGSPRAQTRARAVAHVERTDERRRPVNETARRIERAVATLTARRPAPAAHTIDVDGGRVRLLVHDDGRATRIVALCSPPLREAVERALAHARFTLAAAGMPAGAP